MENLSCSKGRPPDEGVPDILMADDVEEGEEFDLNGAEEQCGAFEESSHRGAGDMSAYHVDIETCDQLMAEPKSSTDQNETEVTVKSEQEDASEQEEEKEPLSYDLAQGNRILTEIMSDANKSLNWPFMDPVDTEGMGLADYHERVKEPMWLRKMRRKFDKRGYSTITEVVKDFRLMLENCYRYNGPDHYISKRGQKLETVFEQKLGLLSRDLREKTSIAATSGKPIEDQIITGTRRRKVLTPHDSSDLLNQLRQEEKDRERENRKQQVEERRQQQQAFVQDMIDWEDNLLGPGGREYLNAMWELPQIGHFLFLTSDVLNTGEVMQWELERSFWMPRQSPVLQLLMTSLLSTPYQRTRLDSKPPMPYLVWEDKLRVRVRNWYKIFNENNRDTRKTHFKIGLEEQFFQVVGLTNPLEKRPFHELTFYQRVWIVKSLCDWCLATQESIREALESQPLVEQRHYDLGTDADGNSYIHFPQFCGQDLRVYRIQPPPMPKPEKRKLKKEQSHKKKKGPGRRGRPAAQPSSTKARQSSRRGRALSPSESSSSDSGINESESSDQEAPCPKPQRRRAKPSPKSSSSTTTAATTTTPTKGRSSRTSAAARDWTPRDASLLAELTGRRGSRSQRLTCAPVNSGTSTPTTTATPSGSRESTPAPPAQEEPGSRSSTPSVDTSSRASSPHKLPTDLPARRGARGRRRKGPQRKRAEEEEEEGMETGEMPSRVKDGGECKSPDIPGTDGTATALSDSNLASTGPTALDVKQEATCVNGYLPMETEVARDGTPFNSYSVEESAMCNGPGLSDTKINCDIDSKPAPACQQRALHLHNPVVDARAEATGVSTTAGPGELLEAETKVLNYGSLKGSPLNGENADHQVGICKMEGEIEEKLCCVKQENSFDCESTDVLDRRSGKEQLGNVGAREDSTATLWPLLPVKDERLDGITSESEKIPELYESIALKSETSPESGLKMEIDAGVKQETDTSVVQLSTPDDATAESSVKQEVPNDVMEENGVKQEMPDDVMEESGVKQEMPGDVMDEAALTQQQEEEELEPEMKFPEVGAFQLVADTVEHLRALSLQFAEPEPIVEIKGKKEKVLRPPPRKRCVSDLYDRMTYLIKELEPWESKLLAVNRKARIKLRKDYESYVDETKEVEDVWESEESQSEDSDENEDSENEEEEEEVEEVDEEAVMEVKKEPVQNVTASPTKVQLKTPKKTSIVSTPEAEDDARDTTAKVTNDPEKSSFGRVRKRKVIPNAYDDPPVNKKKKGKDKDQSPSPSPNILASSRAKNKQAPQEANKIESLRNALSKAKPVSTPSALPPGMQLLCIGGQNVLLNTNTNPPVILQTSAPLNLNNLTLLAQLSAKAAAGNSLGSKKIVVSSASSIASTSTSSTVSVAPAAVATTSSTPSSQPQQQVIRTLLASGHAPQHPKTQRMIQPAAVPSSKVTVHQLSYVESAASSGSTLVTTMASSLPVVTLATHLTGQSLLQSSAGNDGTKPQFYKYNDMSQMKATIRQQLVKTSQGVRTKSTVSTVPPGSTALSNLIQAGLLPQAPRMTASMLQPAPVQVAAVRPAPTVVTIPVKSENKAEVVTTAMSTPAAATDMVASAEVKPPSILSQVLASTGPTRPAQTVLSTNIPPITTQLQLKQVQLQGQQPQSQPQQQSPIKKPHPQPQSQPKPQPQQAQQLVIATSAQSGLQSPTSRNSQTVTILTSPQSSPTNTNLLPKCQLSPEFKAAVKMGIVNESNIGSLIHANPGLVKALNNTMRPKYASNVTVKSLLESRALRQKAQLHGEGDAGSTPVSPTAVLSLQKSAISPVKVQNLHIPSQNEKPVAIQIHNVNTPKPQVLQVPAADMSSASSVSPPQVGISSRPQQLTPKKTLPIQIQSVKVDGQGATQTTATTKAPIQLQALRTPQGTILRTLSGQQVTVRPAGPRQQVSSGGQQVVRLVSPTGSRTVQLVDTASPVVTTNNMSDLDEAVKSVVTSVRCSIPATPQNISSPFNTTGHQPLRQVTMTTNTMKSPIPSVAAMPTAEMNVKTAVSQAERVILTSDGSAVAPGRVVSSSTGLPLVGGQKNVVLRVVPCQQQVMGPQGVVNMVVPQQLLQQSLKAESGTGKVILQAGKGGLQLAQAANSQSVSVSGSTHAGSTSLQPILKTSAAQGNTRTITVFPPGANKLPTKPAVTVDARPMMTTMQQQTVGTDAKPQVQIKLVSQTGAATQPAQRVALGGGQPLKPSHTLVLKKDSAGVGTLTPTPVSHTMLIQKSQLQQLQVMPKVTPSVKQVVGGQSKIRVVSPQLTLSSAGLVPVQVTQSQLQTLSTSVPTVTQAATASSGASIEEVQSQPASALIEQDSMGEVTSSLDLLAAASMLQEAKAPLPQSDRNISNSGPGMNASDNKLPSPKPDQPLLQQYVGAANPAATEEDQQVAVTATSQVHQQQVKQANTTSMPLNKFHQQQAKVLEQQIKLQQQMLEEQQKQQKLIRQLTLQQEVALGGSSTTAPQSVQQVANTVTVPAGKALVTTPTKAQRASVVPSASSSTSAGVQAGVMASVGGRMVQLRFTVPAGMNVQQLLQTSQFQQHLAALKVSAIHGITTSTVTSTTASPPATVTPSPASAASSQVVLSASSGGHPVKNIGNVLPSAVNTRLVNTGPVRVVSAAGNLNKPVMATASALQPTAKTGLAGTIALPQSAKVATAQQSNNKVTVLVNVNGQLVQAQGLSLGNNIRMVNSSGEPNTNHNTAPKVMHTIGNLPAGAKVIQAGNSVGAAAAAPRLLSATQQPILTSPGKMILQTQATTPQKVSGSTPQVLFTRTAGGNVVSPLRLPAGMTLQAASAKTNLLSQLSSSGVAQAAPGGLVIAKPVVASNASQVSYTNISPTVVQNTNLRSEK